MHFAISLLNYRPGRIGGTETYLRQLVAAVGRVRGEDRVTLVCHRANADAIALPDGMERMVTPRGDLAVVLGRCLEAFTPLRARAQERLFRRLTPDAVLFPQQSLFPKALRIPSVLTVQDLQHLVLPQYFNWFDTFFRKGIYGYSLGHADRLIAISEFTRRTLIERCGIAPERVTTVPFGAPSTAESAPAGPPAVEGRYLYYPAATFAHKGHATLLRTFAALRRDPRFRDLQLVFTGQRTAAWKSLDRLVRELGLGDAVTHRGFVSAEEVRRLYRDAEAVVFPTEYEGFGLPVLEAARFRKRVIASRLEVFDEIGLPRSCQIDFRDPEALARSLAGPAATVLEKTAGTWDACARATLAVLRAAACGRGAA